MDVRVRVQERSERLDGSDVSRIQPASDSLLNRVCIDTRVCHGKPCLRGTRIMVWQIVSYLANGDTVEQILAEFPQITPEEDVRACLAYAAELTRERVLPVEVAS